MFIRTHRIRDRTYTEALESYRDLATGKPKHRCIARWPANRTFAQELAMTMEQIRRQQRNGAVKPRLLARLGQLHDVRNKGLTVDETEIHQARMAIHAERRRIQQVTDMLSRGPMALAAAELAMKARALAQSNDPDAIRIGLSQIADALDAMAA